MHVQLPDHSLIFASLSLSDIMMTPRSATGRPDLLNTRKRDDLSQVSPGRWSAVVLCSGHTSTAQLLQLVNSI